MFSKLGLYNPDIYEFAPLGDICDNLHHIGT